MLHPLGHNAHARCVFGNGRRHYNIESEVASCKVCVVFAMDQRYKKIAVAALLLVGATVTFVVIGATGPKSSQGIFHAMYTCIVPSASGVVRSPSAVALVDDQSCPKVGRELVREEEDPKHLRLYPLSNVVFFTQIPYIHDQVMSREFEFLIADLGMHFVFSRYLVEAVEALENVVKFEIVLGYRDSISSPWERMVWGNVSRTLNCGPNRAANNMFICDHFPLFELGSCHHKQYLVNLYITSMPLDHREDYAGLSQLQKLSLYEIHQSPSFTRLWLALKTISCPLSLLAVLWFLRRLVASRKGEGLKEDQPPLITRFLAFLGVCLVFYNAPFQYISLFFDCPWLLVLNDFQQGLFIAALFGFWIIFISEHRPNRDVKKSHIGCYWKQMGVVLVASIFLFVYEFCERGIQVVYPFYSLWTNKFGVIIAWTFISISATSALLYLAILLSTLVTVLRQLRQKQRELSSLSPSAQVKFTALFGNLRFFLIATSVVAVCSVLTVVLPSEVLLHHWQHNKTQYNVYSGILTGNYGMWNAYCLIMMWIYAPSSVSVETTTKRGQSAMVAENSTPFMKAEEQS